MAKLWAGRTDGKTERLADDFNSSIRVDGRMFEQDIRGSIAHATMLGAQKIISEEDAEAIVAGLSGILDDLKTGKLAIDPGATLTFADGSTAKPGMLPKYESIATSTMSTPTQSLIIL